MEKLKITQIKSSIDRSQKQKDTLKALGLNKMNASVVKEISPQVAGMIKKVEHLLKIESV
jgi:large subunit ribosomal protein L30